MSIKKITKYCAFYRKYMVNVVVAMKTRDDRAPLMFLFNPFFNRCFNK